MHDHELSRTMMLGVSDFSSADLLYFFFVIDFSKGLISYWSISIDIMFLCSFGNSS